MFSVLIIIFLISLVSAGVFDWLKKTITGKVQQQQQNMTINVRGLRPAEIVYVSPINPGVGITPTDSSYKPVTFEVYVYDPDGFKDIDKTSVSADFSLYGTTRFTDICSYQNDLPPKKVNFSCTIDMWYWDEAGDWNINVKGKDIGNGTWVYNTSTTFKYNLLRSMVISPVELIWPEIIPESTNQTPGNYTVINNTGNYLGNITIIALNLSGETNNSEAISAEDFTVDTDNTLPECDGTSLSNSAPIEISGSKSNPGNLSLADGSGQEILYYCIPQVPLISSQTYSTKLGGSWTIKY